MTASEACTNLFTLPLMGRVGAGSPATGWGEDPGATFEVKLLALPPTPNPSPPGGGGPVGAIRFTLVEACRK